MLLLRSLLRISPQLWSRYRNVIPSHTNVENLHLSDRLCCQYFTDHDIDITPSPPVLLLRPCDSARFLSRCLSFSIASNRILQDCHWNSDTYSLIITNKTMWCIRSVWLHNFAWLYHACSAASRIGVPPHFYQLPSYWKFWGTHFHFGKRVSYAENK